MSTTIYGPWVLHELIPPRLPSEGTPVSTATRLVGRVKGAFKAIKRSVKPLLPSVQPEATSRGPPESAVAPATEDELAIPPGTLVNRSSFYALPNSSEDFPKSQRRRFSTSPPAFSEVPPSRSSFSDEAYSDSDDELMMDDLQPADPEDLRLVVADMEAMSAKNKEHLAKAAAIRARASELAAEAQNLRTMLEIEKTRRVRMEDYFRHWREMDPEWSYKAVWEGPVTVAPVLARYEGLKGGFLLDQEVGSSDDEELVGQWHRQDGAFRARRKARKGKKAKQCGVPVEAVSDDELASDEDEFYNPPVLCVTFFCFGSPLSDHSLLPGGNQMTTIPRLIPSTMFIL